MTVTPDSDNTQLWLESEAPLLALLVEDVMLTLPNPAHQEWMLERHSRDIALPQFLIPRLVAEAKICKVH